MAAQGDDHFLVPGQLVKVKMPGGNILGGEVVDPTSMGEAHKAALEAKQPARKGTILSVCVRLFSKAELVVVENQCVEPVLDVADADGAEDYRYLRRLLRDRAGESGPSSRRGSGRTGRSSGPAPARQPAPATDPPDVRAAAAAVAGAAGAAGGDLAPSCARPPLLRPKATVGQPFDLVPPPPLPHPAAGTPLGGKRKRPAADVGAPPSKVAALAAPAASGAAGAATEQRRPTRATAGASAPEPQPSARAPLAAPKGKVTRSQAAAEQGPTAPARGGQPAPLAATRQGVARLPAAHSDAAPDRGRGAAPERGRAAASAGKASRSTSRSRPLVPAAQATSAAVAEPAAEPLLVNVPRKPRTPRSSKSDAVAAAAPPSAPPPAPPAALRSRALRSGAAQPVAAQPPAQPAPAPAPPQPAPPSAAHSDQPPAAQPAALPASLQVFGSLGPSSHGAYAGHVADMTARSQAPPVAVPSQSMLPPFMQSSMQPFDLVPVAEQVSADGLAAAAPMSALQIAFQQTASALPLNSAAAAPKPGAGKQRGGPASTAAQRTGAAQQPPDTAASAPRSADAAPDATGAGGTAASGGAALTTAGLDAGGVHSSGLPQGPVIQVRHNALALVLHEKGGSASLAAIMSRFRELAGPRYSADNDKEIIRKLLTMRRECVDIRRLFMFDQEKQSCTLTSHGTALAARLLAGEPAAVRSFGTPAVRKRSSAAGIGPEVKRSRPPVAAAEPGRGATASLLHGAMETAKAEAAAHAKQYNRPTSLGAGVAACHQCGLLTRISGRRCCFVSDGSPPCGATYCEECMDTCYPSLTLEALVQKCPKCSDTCICKECCSDERWKQPPAVPPSYPAAAREHARYLLRLVKGSLLRIHTEQEWELACAGYDAVPMMEEREGRITCDRCKTAIADMFYGCIDPRCNAEYCIKCVDKIRTLHPRSAAGEPAFAGASHDAPMPDAPAPFVHPRLRFDEDTPEALAGLGLQPVVPLQFAPGPGISVQQVYMNAITERATAQGGKLEFGCRLCPCNKHKAPGVAASCAVLLLQRRLPRTFIPRLLLHHAVKDLPEEALPPRCDSGSQDPPREALPCPWCARIAAATEKTAGQRRDLRTNPNLRRASYRGQPDDWLWTPAFEDVNPEVIGPERYADAVAHFQWHWRRRQFPVVRNVHSRMDWGPGSMRVLLDRTADPQTGDMEVLICRSGHPARCSPKDFIDGYSNLLLAPEFDKSIPGDMLKLKDWPPQHSFADTVPRQYVDFINILPFQEYTNMGCGALNMAHTLPKSTVPPDLGPKTYMAYGREPELGPNDSVTRLHQDMSDAVNVLMHSACADERLVQAETARRRNSAIPPAAAASPSAAPAAAAAPQLGALSAGASVEPRFDEFYENSSLGPAAVDLARRVACGDDAVSKMRLAAGLAADVSEFCEEPAECFVLPSCTPVPLGPAGARWETFRREDTAALSAWLMKQAALHAAANQNDRSSKQPVLVYKPVCKLKDLNHAIHNQAFFLTGAEVTRLAEETGVHAWTFMQYDHEAVFIPAGCPHQVRNLRSCIKVALDFVSPEAAREVLVLSDEFAGIANEEKLQSRLMLLHAAKQAVDLLDTHEAPADNVRGA